MESVDICIVGSGFGGAISAARLSDYCSQAGIKADIRVLEKGHDYFGFDPGTTWKYRNAQGNGFMQTMNPDYYSQLVNVTTDIASVVDPTNGSPNFTVIGGNGVGGGSLVYLGVKLRAPSVVFDQTEGDRRLWPETYTRSFLDSYYERCEKVFKVSRMQWSTSSGAPDWQLCTKRDFVFAQGCLKIGASSEPLKVAVKDDTNDGWWNTGQRYPGRQHLPVNYLKTARDNGVTFASDCEVQWIAPNGDRRYVVEYQDKRSNSTKQLECKLLVVSAGAVGSTGLLLKSQDRFSGARELSEHLGLHVSGNGDYATAGVVGSQYAAEGYKGKPMASFCPSFWNDSRFILIPFYAPSMMMAFGQPAEFVYPKDPAATGRRSTTPGGPLWGKEYKKLLAAFGPRVISIAALGLDRCEGVVKKLWTPFGDRITVDWPTTSGETESMWSTALTTMRKIMNALDGELLLDAYREKGHVISAHPLGGCRMAPDKSLGVVDAYGEVWDNPNLFVLDGGIIPSALGVNPSLTIAAVAEVACEKLTRTLSTRLA